MENPNEKENNDDNFAVPTQTHGKIFIINLPTCASRNFLEFEQKTSTY